MDYAFKMHYYLCTQMCKFYSVHCKGIHIDFHRLFTFEIFMKLTNLQRAVAVGQLNAARIFEDVSQTFCVSSSTTQLSQLNQQMM